MTIALSSRLALPVPPAMTRSGRRRGRTKSAKTEPVAVAETKTRKPARPGAGDAKKGCEERGGR
uniref:Uncharacterized protein n=1 Tax=Arundo donax TaxID=35708 RepID=A0A0A9BNR7_ARUDO